MFNWKNFTTFFTNNLKKAKAPKPIPTYQTPVDLQKALFENGQLDYDIKKLRQLLDNIILDTSKNTNENINKLADINTILSYYKDKDTASAIEDLTKNENFLKILSTEVDYDEGTNGANYHFYLTNLKDFLQKYIQYFPSDKLCCETMRKIFGIQNFGRFLVQESSHLKKFKEVANTKGNQAFLDLVLLAANQKPNNEHKDLPTPAK